MQLGFFLFGLIIGSFLNVVILRLMREEPITGRSRCPGCGTVISWYDNIPLISFILLKARCRHCHQKISWQYPLVELAGGFLWLLGYEIASSRFQSGLAMTTVEWSSVIVFGLAASILLCLFVFDLRWSVLPDQITLPGLALLFIANLWLGKNWQEMILSAAIGAAWFGVQYLVSRGRWVGAGDIRLGALMGIILVSWQALFMSLFLAYLAGAVAAIILLGLKKKTWGSQLPFGCFLTAATIITLLYGEIIWQWYFGLFGW